jgi:hypothetical protein
MKEERRRKKEEKRGGKPSRSPSSFIPARPAARRAFARPDVRKHVPRNPALAPSSFRKARVLVVGDVMLDRYWFGEVERISPEAPVPIVRIAREEERAGGAANVARNAASLGAQVTLLTVVGEE